MSITNTTISPEQEMSTANNSLADDPRRRRSNSDAHQMASSSLASTSNNPDSKFNSTATYNSTAETSHNNNDNTSNEQQEKSVAIPISPETEKNNNEASSSSRDSRSKLARPNEGTNTYKAKLMIALSGLIFALCGTCLICAEKAGIADYYFDNTNTSFDMLDGFKQGDNTYTIFIDGLMCFNGHCIDMHNTSSCDERICCDEMRKRISEYQTVDIIAGSIQLVFSFLMFSAMFIRFAMHLGKEVFGNVASRKTIFARIEAMLVSAGNSRNWRRFLFICAGLIMLGLLGACIFLLLESLGILYEPLCPGPTHYPFNKSLSEIVPNVFTWGRGTRLVLFGSGGALFVGLMYLVWLCIFVACAMRKGSYDDDGGDATRLGASGIGDTSHMTKRQKDEQFLDELLNSPEYEDNEYYRKIISDFKKERLAEGNLAKYSSGSNNANADNNKVADANKNKKKNADNNNHNNNNGALGAGPATLSLLDDGFFGEQNNNGIMINNNNSSKQKRNLHQASTTGTNQNLNNNNTHQNNNYLSVAHQLDNNANGELPSALTTSATVATEGGTKKKKKTVVKTLRRKKKKDDNNENDGDDNENNQSGNDDDEDESETPHNNNNRGTQGPHEV